MIIPAKYDFCSSFENGVAAVNLNNKRGFINKAGKEIVPLMFDNIERLEDGRLKCTLAGEVRYFDNLGNRLTE